MPFVYEELGMSPGRANSYARKLDGDCGWVKDPQQSANATNNTPGDESDITYILTIVQAMDCSSAHGTIAVTVEHAALSEVFPMLWTLAFDSDNDGDFDFADTYTSGTDDTPPTIMIDNLVAGRYRVVLESALGCYLKTFDFTILPCVPILPLKLLHFRVSSKGPSFNTFEWKISEVEYLRSVTIESSTDKVNFRPESMIPVMYNEQGTKIFTQAVPVRSGFRYYRLKMIGVDGSVSYSAIINTDEKGVVSFNLWPNPATDRVNIDLYSENTVKSSYRIFNTSGLMVGNGHFYLHSGNNNVDVSVANLPAGTYQVLISNPGAAPISLRFVKH
jgi:hypothetical protein